MKRIVTFIIICYIGFYSLEAQVTKKSLTFDDIESWNRITERLISDNGDWLVYKTEPWKGDPTLYILDSRGKLLDKFNCGTDARFSNDSEFLLFKVVPSYETTRELKLKKTPREDMPKDKLVLYQPGKSTKRIISEIEKYAFPTNWSGWLAYQVSPAGIEKPGGNSIEGEGDISDQKKMKSESPKNGSALHLMNLESGDSLSFPYVTSFSFADDAEMVLFVSTGDNNEFQPGVYIYDFERNNLEELISGKGDFKQVTISEDGSSVAFLAAMENGDKKGEFALFYWNGSGTAKAVFSNSHSSIPDNYIISENGRVSFDREMSRVFFGIAVKLPEKDTTRLEEDYPNVDIWHGTEGKLHTVQVLDRADDLRQTYSAVYHTGSGSVIQLASPEIPRVDLFDEGSGNKALGLSNVAYELQSMWEGGPDHYDVYLIDVLTGNRNLLKRDSRASFRVSPGGKYIYWYNYMDSSYYTYNVADGRENRVTSPHNIAVANEQNDVPNPPSPYPFTGWLKDDRGMLVNDRYDIWQVDPEGAKEPVNLTLNGRTTSTTYRYVNFDREKTYIDSDETLLLMGQNEITRESFYFSWKVDGKGSPKRIIGGKYNLSQPLKAKDSDRLLYTVETFESFPDLLVSDLSFSKSVKISDANPQQDQFLWGSAELVSWTSLDGRKLEGLLYKPENFDPSRKYPLIVNFYERSSNGLYGYRNPELHRSTIDYHYYTSNGYLVFNPDVVYDDGYPGESAFNCVMPGVSALIEKGFVDLDHIGAQGHSWGGYQVAYLATRTDLFAAIESGAPVVNMFSAYGGIRWGSGLNRSFQYEHTQSRIGASIWESPLRYLENSPLFTMDKVTTPILIMANDQDGAVPWYQGIEYFIALRRLQKPVWMLNYNGEPHWPQKPQNKKDFQIRMAQFFDHFLREKPMPKWMRDGIPVIMKEYDLGYDLTEK